MKVALVYDRVNKWGGAERVLLTLHKIFPEAPLYTSVYNSKSAKWAKVFPEIHTSFIQRIPFARIHHEWFPFLMPMAFRSFSFSKYDLVISVTSEFAKNLNTNRDTRHICYCLTPTRYLWSGYGEYFKNPVFKLISKPVVNYLRKLDIDSSRKPDVMVAISTEVQKRIKKFYKRYAPVIYPPHSASSFVRGTASSVPSKPVAKRESSLSLNEKSYFLIVSRLVPYKKVDLVVKAFNENGQKLVIVGTGSEDKKLKKLAKKNIKFAGFISEKKLEKYYRNCKALIFPQHEDFGLVAIEALSYGKPIVAYKAGGALDFIRENKNGIFFKRQTVESLNEAIKKLFTKEWSGDIIASTSSQFSEERFKKEFLAIIKNG